MTPDIIKQVAFARGQILHAGSGEPIVGSLKITAREGPVIVKVLEDGTFVLSGDLNFLFPELNTQDYELTINIRADSPQFRLGFVELANPVTRPIPTSLLNFDPERDDERPRDLINFGTIRLPDDPTNYQRDIPVNIHGRVFEAENPKNPITGATIAILHGGIPITQVTSYSDGRYGMPEPDGRNGLNNLVVLVGDEISCSASGRTAQTRNLLIDFGKLTHEEYFRLALPRPSP